MGQPAKGLMIALTQARRTNMTMIYQEHQKQNQAVVANDPRWARIAARDRTADGHLWYSVVTTGVYCRPTCPSRIANPRNVLLHDTLEEARAKIRELVKEVLHDDPPSPSIRPKRASQGRGE